MVSLNTPTTEPTRTGRLDLALAVALLVLAAFQVALALGAPWGAAAWGGSNDGMLPAGLRVGSAVAASVWVVAALVVLRRLLGPVGRRRTLLVVAVYSSLGVVLNAASPSSLERAMWAPFCLVVAALAWWSWRAARSESASASA
jgi:hypothetical protein